VKIGSLKKWGFIFYFFICLFIYSGRCGENGLQGVQYDQKLPRGSHMAPILKSTL
jgi:hypothetical protein